jgi:hypothetical protein
MKRIQTFVATLTMALVAASCAVQAGGDDQAPAADTAVAESSDLPDDTTLDSTDVPGDTALDSTDVPGDTALDSTDVPVDTDVPPDVAPSCGDGTRNGQEPCEGDDFGTLSCQMFGLGEGQLGCNANCELVLADCDVPCTPDCSNAECGPDPTCGITCGVCTEGLCSPVGTCDSPCSGGTTLCADRCVDQTSDPDHCGACDRPCPASGVCDAGVCRVAADCRETPCIGFSFCDQASGACLPGCDDTAACQAAEVCDLASHACVCAPGSHRCAGACVADSATEHCGDRCDPCAGGANGEATCDGGVCGLGCDDGAMLCAGTCAPCPDAVDGVPICDATACVLSCAPGLAFCEGVCASDIPDDAFTDANCDGIDGDGAIGFFVAPSPLGQAGAPGTAAAPVSTIQAGIDLAAGSSRSRKEVYVAAGTYLESIVLASDVSIYGGYDAAAGWVRDGTTHSEIDGGTTAVLGENVSNVTLQELSILAADATQPGSSSYGVRLLGCSAIRFEGVGVIAGAGAHGADGVMPDQAQHGAASTQPPECRRGCSTCPLFCWGGDNAVPPDCSFVGVDRPGFGGDGGNESANGSNGSSVGAAIGGARGAGSGNCHNPGAPAGHGDHGAAGEPATAEPSVSNALNAGLIVGGTGGSGTRGAHGAGGGGGGGSRTPCTFDEPGRGGGAGGSGGCGGLGGPGGHGGGTSVAVFLVDSTVDLGDSILIGVAGGNGGNGAVGGLGGFGAVGGPGGINSGLPSGGAGGFGGDGGPGGPGAGGPAGLSRAIDAHNSAWTGTPTLLVGANGQPGMGAEGAPGGGPGDGDCPLLSPLPLVVPGGASFVSFVSFGNYVEPSGTDKLQFEFWSTAVGSFDLASGDNANYLTCQQCVLLHVNALAQPNLATATTYFQTQGQITVSQVSDTEVQLILTDVQLVEVNITAALVSKPVPGGRCVTLNGAFSTQ